MERQLLICPPALRFLEAPTLTPAAQQVLRAAGEFAQGLLPEELTAVVEETRRIIAEAQIDAHDAAPAVATARVTALCEVLLRRYGAPKSASAARDDTSADRTIRESMGWVGILYRAVGIEASSLEHDDADLRMTLAHEYFHLNTKPHPLRLIEEGVSDYLMYLQRREAEAATARFPDLGES